MWPFIACQFTAWLQWTHLTHDTQHTQPLNLPSQITGFLRYFKVIGNYGNPVMRSIWWLFKFTSLSFFLSYCFLLVLNFIYFFRKVVHNIFFFINQFVLFFLANSLILILSISCLCWSNATKSTSFRKKEAKTQTWSKHGPAAAKLCINRWTEQALNTIEQREYDALFE